MKIGFDFRMGGSINSGIGRYSYELLKNILQQNVKHSVVVFYNEYNSDATDINTLQQLGAEMVIANFSHYSLAEQFYFPKLLNKYNLDLVHFPNFNAPVFYNKPFVVTIHDMVHHKISGHKKSTLWKFYAYKYIINKVAKKAKKIITITESAKSEITAFLGVPNDKVAVIYEGPTDLIKTTDIQIKQIKSRFLLSRPYFLFVGTLERKKNLITLAKAFDYFLDSYNFDMDLVIAGKVDSHYPQIKDEMLEHCKKNRIVFTGYVTDTEQACLYDGAYAFITTSLHEGFGLPGLEAMSHGLPVLASNTNVFNEVYDNGAIFFEPLDIKDIAKCMDLVASDSDFYKQMQSKAVARASKFDWSQTAEETLAVYEMVATTNHHFSKKVQEEIYEPEPDEN